MTARKDEDVAEMCMLLLTTAPQGGRGSCGRGSYLFRLRNWYSLFTIESILWIGTIVIEHASYSKHWLQVETNGIVAIWLKIDSFSTLQRGIGDLWQFGNYWTHWNCWNEIAFKIDPTLFGINHFSKMKQLISTLNRMGSDLNHFGSHSKQFGSNLNHVDSTLAQFGYWIVLLRNWCNFVLHLTKFEVNFISISACSKIKQCKWSPTFWFHGIWPNGVHKRANLNHFGSTLKQSGSNMNQLASNLNQRASKLNQFAPKLNRFETFCFQLGSIWNCLQHCFNFVWTWIIVQVNFISIIWNKQQHFDNLNGLRVPGSTELCQIGFTIAPRWSILNQNCGNLVQNRFELLRNWINLRWSCIILNRFASEFTQVVIASKIDPFLFELESIVKSHLFQCFQN